MNRLLWVACAAFALGLFVSPGSASARTLNVPSAGGQTVIGTNPADGKPYFAFQPAGSSVCTVMTRIGTTSGLNDIVQLFGSSGNDSIRIASANAPLCGITFTAVDVNDFFIDVWGYGGQDWIVGRFSNADGGSGNDVLSGEQGYAQNLVGGAGDDYLYGPTDSQLNGGFGNDIFCAQSGATPYLFSGGDGSANYTDKGCGPVQVTTNMDSVGGAQCPGICQIL